MVWLKIDDQIAHHPKFVEAGPLASWLWVCGNGYCNKYLTDGFIPQSALKSLGTVPSPAKWATRLVEVGLWELVDGGFRVHDFHDQNPKASDVKAKRKADRLRKESTRNPRGQFGDSVKNPTTPSRPVPSVEENNVHTQTRASGPTGSGVFGGMLPRDHLKHSWCGRKCVPEFLHLEFCRALGGSLGTANDTLRGSDGISGWYLDVCERMGDKPNGDEPVKFWRAQFAAKWPGEQPQRAPAVSLVCPDIPPCPMGTTSHDCQKRTALEAGRRQAS